MINKIKRNTEIEMKKKIEKFKKKIKKIQINHISEELLENILIEAYGTKVPLIQLANITKENQQTLIIIVFDKKLISKIKNSIKELKIELNYSSIGNKIRVQLPTLTQERRNKMIKIVKKKTEEEKISIRNIRRNSIAQIKNLKKNKEITKDDEFKTQNNIQKTTEIFIKKIEEISKKKEEELIKI